MGLVIPPRVELVYSIEPDVLKPGVQAQTALAQLIKNEASQRFSRGESLFFRLNVAGLFDTTWRVIAYEGEIEEDREKRPGLSRVTSVSSPRAIAGCCQLSGSPEKALMPDGQSCLDSL